MFDSAIHKGDPRANQIMVENHGVNLFVHTLAKDTIEHSDGTKIQCYFEDNIGEAIHLHYGNIRLDFSIDEFKRLADAVKIAEESM